MPGKNVLVVNAGSSSLKLSVLDPGDQVTASLELERWDGRAEHPELAEFIAGQKEIAVTGHRVVHGGSEYTGPVLIDRAVQAGIEALTELAPLHQPRALAGIKAVSNAMPGAPAVACFDTAFHATLPPEAATYALPAQWRRQYGQRRFTLRRYGFHGLSHAYAARRAAQLLGADPARLRIVTCHLGAGASLAAVHGGRSVDTTMGFTPLDGLVMNTRSGSVDPGLVIWLARSGGLSPADLADGLDRQSGLAGLADLPNRSGDLRDVRAAARAGHAEASLAIAIYLHRLRREIAAMAAAMNGLDALVFTGGVGEHDPAIRADTAAGLAFLGIVIDPDLNQAAAADTEITAPGAPVRVLRITAREDVEIARQARELVELDQ